MKFITSISSIGTVALIASFSFAAQIYAQRIAVLSPDKTDQSREFGERLARALSEKMTVLDDALAEAAYLSAAPATPFNLTAEESKKLGAVIGCDFFVLSKSALQPRSASGRPAYVEAYASIFVVSARSGRMVLWLHPSHEAVSRTESAKLLSDAIPLIASTIGDTIRLTVKDETALREEPVVEFVPEEGSPAAKDFRPPVPYRRFKPEYTAQAAFYDVTATVDMLIDLDAKGDIRRIQVVRWAGYGLDESVEKTVRAMNWRPAERNGKPLPMRFLVRYNFKKIEKE